MVAMPSTLKSVPAAAAILLLGGFASLLLIIPQAGAQTVSPRFTYSAGSQGYGYYANPRTSTRVATTRSGGTTRPRSVGPGARDWSTGRRSRLAKPWLRPMD